MKTCKRRLNFPFLTLATGSLAAAIFLLAGCGGHAPKLSTDQAKAFADAPPEVRQTWEKALAADKANDYLTAVEALDSLKKMTLTDPQTQALDAERNAFSERLRKAVDRNDPAAVQAVIKTQKPRAQAQAQ